MTIPRLELIEDTSKKNDFIIFRHKIKGKKVPTFSKNTKLSFKRTRRISKRHKTRKHKKRKSFFNIF